MTDWPAIDAEFLEFVKTQDALFHYTKRATARDRILHSKRLRLSTRQGTNDPWEYRFRLLNASGSFTPETEKLYNEVHTNIDRVLRSEYRTASFCSNNRPELILENGDHVEDAYALIEGWNKPRMWAQYGESHAGACIVFSKEALEASLSRLGFQTDSTTLGKVLYTQRNRMPYQTFTIDADRLIETGREAYATEFVRTRTNSIFFLKHIDYRDEAEYRLAVYDQNDLYEFIDVSSSLKGVIWGDRTAEQELKELHPKCTKSEVGCGFVRWDRGTSHLLHCTPKGET